MSAPPPAVLIDTDVLIDYLRGQPQAIAYLDMLTNPLYVSVMTIAELYVGVRDGAERTRLDTFLLAFTSVPITDEIAVRGGLLRRDYGRSHGTGLADAIIAATALNHSLMLVTRNTRHFPMLADLIDPY